jgi:small ligand-binding sensory domain FIST
MGPTREVTACERNIVTELDGEPALPCLLRDLGLDTLDDPRAALPRLRATLVGLTDATDTALSRPGQFGTDTRVRHLVGLDPGRHAVAVADLLQPGMRLAFCQRDVAAARRDLVRVCSEIRDELESADEPASAQRRVLGALYVSCTGRGGPHFGGPSAELKLIQHALGGGGEEIPLVGFFAAGEIARHHLYGYTGVLTVFTGGG